jgi:outer membrane lipoprotein-sorting protein
MVSIRSHLAGRSPTPPVSGVLHTPVAADVSRRHLRCEKHAPTDVGDYTLSANRAKCETSRPAPCRVPVLLATAMLCLLAGTALASPSDALLDRWISAQTNLHTWTADCTQTRSLKVLSQPLVSNGKVWVMVPDRFRWELGQPAQTVALRQPDQLFLIYPRLKRLEKYPLHGAQPGPWRDALALLEASFPRSRADLESRFRVSSVTETNSMIQVTLQPKSASARKFMAEIQVNVSTNGFSPLATELRFSDGSSMRNDFTNVVINAPLGPELFDAKVDPDFSVVEPLRP